MDFCAYSWAIFTLSYCGWLTILPTSRKIGLAPPFNKIVPATIRVFPGVLLIVQCYLGSNWWIRAVLFKVCDVTHWFRNQRFQHEGVQWHSKSESIKIRINDLQQLRVSNVHWWLNHRRNDPKLGRYGVKFGMGIDLHERVHHRQFDSGSQNFWGLKKINF